MGETDGSVALSAAAPPAPASGEWSAGRAGSPDGGQVAGLPGGGAAGLRTAMRREPAGRRCRRRR
eukprot:9189739-Pyramimonas_sp.AAC.1